MFQNYFHYASTRAEKKTEIFSKSIVTVSVRAGRIGPLPNLPLANRPPKKVGPGQIGPLKIWPWTNRPPVENFCNLNLFVDLQRAFDWVDKDISS